MSTTTRIELMERIQVLEYKLQLAKKALLELDSDEKRGLPTRNRNISDTIKMSPDLKNTIQKIQKK